MGEVIKRTRCAHTSNDDYFEWVCTANSDIYYDYDYGFCGGSTYGVFDIYCRYRYNPDIVSNTAKIIVSDDYEITSLSIWGARSRNSEGHFKPLLNMFNEFNGETTQEKAENYLISCGVSKALIKNFQEFMLD